MIINNGPIGRKFNPLKDILIIFGDLTYSLKDNFSIENKYNFSINNITGKWDLKLLTNCNVIFKNKIDIYGFMIGGGQAGSKAQSGSNPTGGRGGDGGKYQLINQQSLKRNTNIIVTIGAGGNTTAGAQGDNSSIKINENILSTANGTCKEGGRGQNYPNTTAGEGSPGVTYHGNIYGGGGGGGGANQYNSTDYWNYHNAASGDGGSGGGGRGAHFNINQNNGSLPSRYSTAGNSYTGGGGGGGCTTDNNSNHYPSLGDNYGPKAGGSGVVILSNYE